MSTDSEDFRINHIIRATTILNQLAESGAPEEPIIDFYFKFKTNNKTSVKFLKAALMDYSLSVTNAGVIKKTYTLSGNTGAIKWTEDQLIKWIDYLIQVGSDTGCKFTDCGSDFSLEPGKLDE